MTRLKRGDLIPHFAVETLQGGHFSYVSIWQHRALLLVIVPPASGPDAISAFVAALERQRRTLELYAMDFVVTRDVLPWSAELSAVVCDRWGEVHHVWGRDDNGAFPPVDDLLEWVAYVQMRCPECEGEAR